MICTWNGGVLKHDEFFFTILLYNEMTDTEINDTMHDTKGWIMSSGVKNNVN